jgi:hypothetical protein
MPEVGSICWLCEPSDGVMPFVLAWASGQDEANFTARKRQLNPGDIYLGTRDENFLYLHRGGVVQIGSTGICQRIFMPVNNTIKDFCENYGLHTLGGDLEWTIKRDETKHVNEGNPPDGKRPALLKLSAKEFANDDGPIAELEIGSLPDDDKAILSLTIYNKGGGDQKISLAMTKDGDVRWNVANDVSVKVNGNYTFTIEKDLTGTSKTLTYESKETIDVKAGTKTTLTSPEVTVDAKNTLIKGVTSCDGQVPVTLATPLMIWLAAHTHELLIPKAVTTPPTVPPPGTIASKKLFSS